MKIDNNSVLAANTSPPKWIFFTKAILTKTPKIILATEIDPTDFINQ